MNAASEHERYSILNSAWQVATAKHTYKTRHTYCACLDLKVGNFQLTDKT